jgi:pyruvate dehydrogenase phosphatase
MLLLKGLGVSTFASSAMVAACAEVKGQEGDDHTVYIPRVSGSPSPMTAPHSSMCAVSSNSFYEDRSVVRTTLGAGGREHYFAVLDGHGGWDCAEFAYPLLPHCISECLSAGKQPVGEAEVEEAIQQGFLKVEESWTKNLKKEWLKAPNYITYGPPGSERLSSVGTCVLLACIHRGTLYVANCGDSRAVLAQRGFGGGYRAQRVTTDLNAMNTSEQERLKRDHPGEPDIFRCRGPYSCYVKGCLQPTYSLGDAYLKYPHFNNFPGRVIAEPYRPPYIRTAPQVTARPLSSVKEGDFLILATDGVWDYLSDQNAVDLVCRAQRRGEHPAEAVVSATLELAASRFGISTDQLREMPLGKQRRRVHDDATVIVVDLWSAVNDTGLPPEQRARL